MAVFFASEAVYLAQRSSTLGRSIYGKIVRIFFSAVAGQETKMHNTQSTQVTDDEKVQVVHATFKYKNHDDHSAEKVFEVTQ